MGGGKTRTALEILERLQVNGPILVLCRPKGIYHWVSEILKWTDTEWDDIRIARGDPASRHLIWLKKERYRFIITTHQTALRDKKYLHGYYWPGVVVDESHRLRKRKTKIFEFLKGLRYDIFLPMSGSQFRDGPQDVWTLLHLCDKKVFGSYWKFVNTFVYVIKGNYGAELGGPRNTARFRDILKRYTAHVKEAELEGALPERNRMFLDIDMDPKQAKLYHDIEDDLLVELDSGGLLVSRNEMVQLLRLRQCLTCPQMLDNTQGPGAALEAVIEHADEERHFVIFTPFARALPIWEEHLKNSGYRDVFTIRGQMKDKDVDENVRAFQDTKGILLCTIGISESWQVLTCDKAYFIQYDWSPDTNMQAEDRLRRVTSHHKHVNYYYVRHWNTIDYDVLEAVNTRHNDVRRALYDPATLRALLKRRTDKNDQGTS